MANANIRIIPNYISARSEKLLRRKYLRLQVNTGKQYTISTIVFANDKWVLWYFDEATDLELVTDIVDKSEVKDGD